MVDAGQVWSFRACLCMYSSLEVVQTKMVAVRRRVRLFEKELEGLLRVVNDAKRLSLRVYMCLMPRRWKRET